MKVRTFGTERKHVIFGLKRDKNKMHKSELFFQKTLSSFEKMWYNAQASII